MSELEFLYRQTRQMRADLLAFLGTLPPEVLSTAPPEYGQGSVLSTLSHVAGCYGFWTGQVFLAQLLEESGQTGIDLSTVVSSFERVDALMELAFASPRLGEGEFSFRHPSGHTMSVSPRWLVLHPVTHEFHHKGQVVTLLRKLGHPVTVDLDLPPPGGW